MKLSSFFVFMLMFFSFQVNALNGESCDAQKTYQERMEKFMIDSIPSVLEECGIGNLFDFCGMFGGVLGELLGLGCGGKLPSTNFCGVEFDMNSLISRDSGTTSVPIDDSELYASNLTTYLELDQ